MKYLTVRITPEHIKNGEPSSCSICPLALALEDAGVIAPIVTEANWWDTESAVIGQVSRRARQWIHRFDNGRPVKPAVFRLRRLN